MAEERSFIDDLIAEAEARDELQSLAYYDLLLAEIQNLSNEMVSNFSEADKEIEIIRNWVLGKNSKLQQKVEWIERKLENFIREKGVKTLGMAHGVLKMHKKPDKVEIVDLDSFLMHAKVDMLAVIPEQIKPDMGKIKIHIRNTGHIPSGISVTKGKEEFSYKLNDNKEVQDVRQAETGIAVEQAMPDRAAV